MVGKQIAVSTAEIIWNSNEKEVLAVADSDTIRFAFWIITIPRRTLNGL